MFPTAHGILSQGGKGHATPEPEGASPLPPATEYRLFVYEQSGGTDGNISELWLGTDETTRFPGNPTQSASGGTPTNLVNDSVTDSNTNTPGGNGSWWGLGYPTAHKLGHVKVARSNINTLYPRTWALRLWEQDRGMWLAGLVRPFAANDLTVSNEYVPFDLSDARVLAQPIYGNTNGGVGSGWAVNSASPSNGAAMTTQRRTHVVENDAVLCAWAVTGTAAPALGEISSPSETMNILHHGPGLLLALRTTLADDTEPDSYSATNETGAQRGAVFGHRVLLNIDPDEPVGQVAVSLGTATPPPIVVTPNQAIIVAAVYETGTVQTLPAGFTPIISGTNPVGSSGRPRLLVGIRIAQDDGVYQPGSLSGAAAKVVTAAINAVTL